MPPLGAAWCGLFSLMGEVWGGCAAGVPRQAPPREVTERHAWSVSGMAFWDGTLALPSTTSDALRTQHLHIWDSVLHTYLQGHQLQQRSKVEATYECPPAGDRGG